MALDLTPEQKATGKANFEQATGDLARAGRMNTMVAGGAPDPKNPDRRDFLKVGLAAGAVVPVSAAVYFGYDVVEGEQGRPDRPHRLRRRRRRPRRRPQPRVQRDRRRLRHPADEPEADLRRRHRPAKRA